MHCIRRAALQSAVSASRAVAVKPRTFSIASPTSRSTNAAKIACPAALRCFSQTTRAANIDEADGENLANSAAESSTISTSNSFSSNNSFISSKDGQEGQAVDGEGQQLRDGETPHGLFVRNMVFEANEDHLREAFEKYGEISKTVIARDARGLSRGYGFVWFKNADEMEKACAGTNGSFWHGRRVQVSVRQTNGKKARQGAAGPTRSIYIGNIPYETTDAELNRIFRELDNVTDVRVAVDRTTGWPRGFAHADFADVESAVAGMQKLEGMTIGGRALKFDYAVDSNKYDSPPGGSRANYGSRAN